MPPFGAHKRSLKDYNHDALNQLDVDGLIVGSNKSRSVFLTDKGAARAKELLQKYMFDRVKQSFV